MSLSDDKVVLFWLELFFEDDLLIVEIGENNLDLEINVFILF